MKSLLLTIILAFLLVAPVSAQDTTITGNYRVQGTNPNGSKYTGTATISEQGDLYRIEWRVGRDSFVGVGVLIDDTLTVSYGNEACAVVAYTQDEDGTLNGIWGGMDSRTTGTEIATPQHPDTLSTPYTLTGTNPDRSRYRGSMEVGLIQDVIPDFETDGLELYILVWDTGSTGAGIGHFDGEILSATYTNVDNLAACGLVVYTLEKNGKLDGIWTMPGLKGMGTDTLSRTK